MHIHKPKALHGWREFVGEIGVIVCGVLIAIALGQTVEALHHRGEAKEMIRKLRVESVENRRVLAGKKLDIDDAVRRAARLT